MADRACRHTWRGDIPDFVSQALDPPLRRRLSAAAMHSFKWHSRDEWVSPGMPCGQNVVLHHGRHGASFFANQGLYSAPDGLYNVAVERIAFLECLVQADLTNVGSHGRLCQLGHRKERVLYPIGRLLWVHHLRVTKGILTHKGFKC